MQMLMDKIDPTVVDQEEYYDFHFVVLVSHYLCGVNGKKSRIT